MAIYRTGQVTVVSGGAAQNLNLGFVPSLFTMSNQTIQTSGTVTGVCYAYWDQFLGALSTPATLIDTYSSGAPTRSALTTTGISIFQSKDSDLFTPQQAPYTSHYWSKQCG